MVLGLGLSILVPTLTTVAMNSVEGQHSGLASGVNNAVSRTAGLLAIAAMGVMMFMVFDSDLDSRLAYLDLTAEVREQLEEEKANLGAAEAPEDVDRVTATAIERAIGEAFVDGFRIVMLVAAGIALASALSAVLLIEGKKLIEEGGRIDEPSSQKA